MGELAQFESDHCWDQGFLDYDGGYALEANPYSEGSEQARWWEEGWTSAEADAKLEEPR